MNPWKVGGGLLVALLLGGFIVGYLEYREVAEQVEPMRERWEAARDTVEAQESRLRAWRQAWRDTVDVLDTVRDSLQEERRRARNDTQEALDAAELAEEGLESSLNLLRERVRPELVSAVDTVMVRYDSVEARHHRVQQAYERQVRALRGLLENARQRRDHWRAAHDSVQAINDQLHTALAAAEDERDTWKRKAQFDLLSDGPKRLLTGALFIGAWEGAKALLGGSNHDG